MLAAERGNHNVFVYLLAVAQVNWQIQDGLGKNAYQYAAIYQPHSDMCNVFEQIVSHLQAENSPAEQPVPEEAEDKSVNGTGAEKDNS